MLNEVINQDEWQARARTLSEIVEKYRDEGEQTRHLPQPVFDAIRDAGFLRLWLPTSCGGYSASIETVISVVEEVARHDGAAAWNLAIAIVVPAFTAFLPLDSLSKVLGGKTDVAISGSVFPRGATAVPASGGYRLSGRWSLASGCQQAEWLIAGSLVFDEGVPRLDKHGRPDLRMFFLPARQAEILDTWHASGLRATGSHDFVLDNLFVGERYQFSFRNGRSSYPDALYAGGLGQILGWEFAGVSLGLARDALDSFRQLAHTKTPTTGTGPLVDQQLVQLRVGMAEALLRSSRAFLMERARASTVALEGGTADQATEILGGLARAQVGRSAVEAVDLVLACAGTTAVHETSRLERCARDVRVVPHHIAMSERQIERAGQHLLRV